MGIRCRTTPRRVWAWIRSVIDLSGYDPGTEPRFVFASDLSGAASGWYVAKISLYDGDVASPQFDVTEQPTNTQDWVGPYVVQTTLLENETLQSAELSWRVSGGDIETVDLVELGGNAFSGAIPGQLPNQEVEWRLQASDGATEEMACAGGRRFASSGAPQQVAITEQRQGHRRCRCNGMHRIRSILLRGMSFIRRTERRFVAHSHRAVPIEPSLELSWTVRARYDVVGNEGRGRFRARYG